MKKFRTEFDLLPITADFQSDARVLPLRLGFFLHSQNRTELVPFQSLVFLSDEKTIPPRAESHLAIGLTASNASDLGSCALSASNPDGFHLAVDLPF